MSESDASVSATVELADSTPISSIADHSESEGFVQGATWSLIKLAAWLETTNIVAGDKDSQRTVDETKLLIAEQARQAAAHLRFEK